jgi:hypothetical protein
LRGILDKYQIIPVGNVPQSVNVCRLPANARCEDCPGPRSQSSLETLRTHIQPGGINVHRYRSTVTTQNGRHSCHKRDVRNDRLISATNAQAPLRRLELEYPVGAGNGTAGFMQIGKDSFKSFDLPVVSTPGTAFQHASEKWLLPVVVNGPGRRRLFANGYPARQGELHAINLLTPWLACWPGV